MARSASLPTPAPRRDRLIGPGLGIAGLLLLLPFLAGLVPIVRFPRERVDVVLSPGEIEVAGLYVYRNPWPFPVTQGFTIPLPVDPDHPTPTELSASRLGSDRALPLPLRSFLGEVGFEIPFAAFQEVEVVVRYRQLARDGHGRYLLTTTWPWRRPLNYGLYTMRLRGVTLLDSNYPLAWDGQGTLRFERTDFMPAQDWQFSWETRG
jgi:hypothetical protein